MRITATSLPGVLLIEPEVFTDRRGFLVESYHERRYRDAGIPPFVQHNHTHSVPGTLRGLHYQRRHPQGKLVRCVRGAVFDVAVDVRRSSPSFGRWIGVELSEQNKRQLYIPPGFAHGYCVPGVASDVEYACTELYDASDDRGIIWSDPTLNIAWSISAPILSDKDARLGPLSAAGDDLPE